VADDVVVVAGDIGKARNGQSDIVCVKDHRDVITIGD
jgi:hypothetical protein